MMEFKICSLCQNSWATRAKFIASKDIKLIGYQPDFETPGDGLFLFNHTKQKCGTTMALPTSLFFDLYDGPIYKELKKGYHECGGYCLEINNLSPCTAHCAMAHIRQIMQIISAHHHEK
jgi:hypothetical protein